MIEGEALDDILRQMGVQVSQGEHRRNIVTRGVRLHELEGKRFAVGNAVLEYDRPRPPCHYVETLTEPGMTRALAGGRGGICARVVRAATIRVNDPIQVQAGELLCPCCYRRSNGRGKPAAPEEFRTCPVTAIDDTEEFFIRLEDGTDRLVHRTVVHECDYGPKHCLKADVVKSDDSGRTAHKSQFTRGALSGKNLLPDDPNVINSPSGRIDTSDNFSRSWTDDVPFLTDELCFCPNCGCNVAIASVAGGFCDFCKPKPKEKPTQIAPDISSLVPAEVFEEGKQRRFSAQVRQRGHALRVVVQKKPHVLLRLLSFGLIKAKPIHSLTFFREHDDQHWVLVRSKKESE